MTAEDRQAYFEHLAEKYLERALDEYDVYAQTPERTQVIRAMVNSLADRFQMIDARARDDARRALAQAAQGDE